MRTSAAMITITLAIAGCATPVPVRQVKIPDLPPVLREPCESLMPIEKKANNEPYSFVDVLKTTVDNYRRGTECKIKHQSTVDWVDDQRKILEIK